MSKRKASSDLDSEIPPTKQPRLSSSKTLHYPNLSLPRRAESEVPPFQLPTRLITFSYTPTRTLEFTDSALRYFVEPPIPAKLSYGYERWIKKPEEKPRIDGLLKAYDEVKGKAKRGEVEVSLEGVGVVGWRGVLTRILTAPYEGRDGWDMNVMCVKGTMYFEEHLTKEKIKEKDNLEPRHRIQTYYGYAFESYCTSDTPERKPQDGHPPGWSGDVDTNVQWCNVVRTKLGDMRMVIGGEVDCINSRDKSLVELKTSLTIRNAHDEAKFERKLAKFYFQSFLLGVPEIVVGFRTPSGDVTTTQKFKMIEIPRLVRGKRDAWDPALCLRWGYNFLSFLKGAVSDSTKVWRVRFIPKEGVRVFELDAEGVQEVQDGEDRVGFLPKWYYESCII